MAEPFLIGEAMTGGYGCDVYIEATGNPKGVTQGLEMIRKMGRFVEFSVFKELVTADWSIIGDTKELDIMGAHLSPHSYPVALRMIEQGLLNKPIPWNELVWPRVVDDRRLG